MRRTSLRDKTLTTKKDAVEEARLRLQAQEVFIAPDGTTHADTNGLSGSSNNTTNNHHSTLALLDGVNDTTATTALASTHDYNWLTKTPTNNNNNANNNNNNNNTISSNNNNDKKVAAYTASLATATAASATTTTTTNGSVNTYLPHSLSAMDVMDASSHAFNSRRPPEGRENDELQLNAYKAGGGEHHRSTSATAMIVSDRNNMTAAAASTAGPDAVHIQSSKEAANGKINVQVTVLVGKWKMCAQHTNVALLKGVG